MSVHEILKQPIETDLLEHYTKYITMVQDWESIRVFDVKESKDAKEVILDYCYARVKDGDEKGKKGTWEKCKRKSSDCKKQCGIDIFIDQKERSILKDTVLKDKLLNNQEKHIVCSEINLGNMHKALLEDIFTERYIPELDEYDKSRCESKIVLYEYPTYTIFPEDEQEEYTLGLYYERQQIELLRQLATKFKVLRHSIKAALSAIISRNHSHHIGSHVMPRTTAEKVSKRVIELDITKQMKIEMLFKRYPSTKSVFEGNAKFKKECLESDKFITKDINQVCKDISEDVEEFVNKLIEKTQFKDTENETHAKYTCEIVNTLKDKLDEYIQKKADFTAEIATEPLTTTKTMKFIDEVFTQFTENTLLMDNIGANEGVRYRSLDNNRLKINFLRNGSKWSTLEYECGCPNDKKRNLQDFPYSTKCFCNQDLLRKCDEDGGDDISIALPGCLGEFAIYAFLENFIRNGIKHNKEFIDNEESKNFEISVDLCDLDKDSKDKDEFYKLKIWDNFTKPEKDITVKDENGEEDIKLHQYLQRLIDLQIVNNDGSLRKEAWGMSEMKIMATLLRGSTDFTNMAENLKVTCEEKNGSKRLIYNLLIMKPKNVAIISDEEINNKNQEQNKDGIWWFKSTDELKDHVLKGSSPVSFKFLIIGKSESGLDKLKQIKPLLPFRIMIKEGSDSVAKDSKWYRTISIDNLNKIIMDNGSGILDITWKAWMEKFIESKGYSSISLLLFFEQEASVEPTRSWYNNKDGFNGQKNTINLSVLYKGRRNNELSRKCDNTKILMYDRHFGGFSYFCAKSKKDEIIFHEAFDKGSSDFVHISTLYHKEIVYELVEAALLNVLVIDERVAEVAYDKTNLEQQKANRAYNGLEKLLIAKKAGVFICTHVCINDDTVPLHPSINNKEPVICVKFNVKNTFDTAIKVNTSTYYCTKKKFSRCKESKSIDAVIIHQGVLENFFKEELQGDKDKYNKFLESLQESIPYVIIDSGRGIPAKLPDAAKFLPFSILEDFIMKERIAKYSLTKNIMSLTRRK